MKLTERNTRARRQRTWRVIAAEASAISRVMPPIRVLAAAAILSFPTALKAQTPQLAPERTWPELKEAVQDRASRQAYPLIGFNAQEVAEILSRITSRDPEEWARAWSENGEKHWKAAEDLKGTDRIKARQEYLEAWKYFSFGAWPVQNSPGKKQSHARGLEAFRAYIGLADPPMEVIRVPFEGKEIVSYLQLPKDVRPAPVVISVGGLDSYKEYVAEQYGPDYISAKLGYLALDMPGTSEAPLLIDVGAERMISRVIDHLQTRGDIDGRRIAIQGVSFGGYWAARTAFVEKDRLRGAVVWGAPVDGYFQREWQIKALGTREYLFDLFPARASVYGLSGLEEYLSYVPRMSLKEGGFIGKPSAPMLLVNGERDSQVPIDDLYILLRNGSPKEAWVNPQGGHLGRNREIPDTKIFSEIIVPWLSRQLK